MTDFLYSLAIEPLELCMRFVLLHAHALTGSWGQSIVLLSLAVNIALIPVYHLAESWQEAERNIQKKIRPHLADIKAVYHGRERYFFTQALYRVYSYSPLYTLRTSCGLLIQIPFFFAAYHLLQAEPEIAGNSFLFIRDLAKPDALLFLSGLTINILPFIMTAVNLLSAAVYTTRLSTAQKAQLYGLALLFLVLLYTAGSALLVYWTCNNLFSLFKNIVYTRYIYSNNKKNTVTPRIQSLARIPATLAGALIDKLHSRTDILFAVPMVIALVTADPVRKQYGLDPAGLFTIALAVLFGLIAIAIRLHKIHKSSTKDLVYKSLPWLLFGLLVVVFTTTNSMTAFKRFASISSSWFFHLRSLAVALTVAWCLSRQPFVFFLVRAGNFCRTTIAPAHLFRCYLFGLLLAGTLIFWYTPTFIYFSDPDFFYESLAVISGRLIASWLICTGLGCLFYRFTPHAARPLLAATAVWFGLSSLLYTFVAAGDYGNLDGFILQNPALLRVRWAICVDIAVCTSVAGFLFFVLKKQKASALLGLLQGLAALLFLVGATNIALAPPKEGLANNAGPQLPDYTGRLFGFSRHEPNSIIIMLDMFTGGHLDKMTQEEPELFNSFEGFTWYKDTISAGATTLLSIPSLLGGPEYTPEAINQRTPAVSIQDEIHKGMAVLPNMFIERGYDVAFADLDGLIPQKFIPFCPRNEEMLLVGKSFVTAYTPYWREMKGLPSPKAESQSPFLISLGLFRAAPWAIRQHIYGGGAWLDTQTLGHNPSEGPMAILDLMPEISNTNTTNRTFKYMASQVSHYPWRLDKDTCMPLAEVPKTTGKDGLIFEHYYAERCALRAIARWITWLKQENIYDNTQIIITSDHSAGDSTHLNQGFEKLKKTPMPWKPHSLLLVKNYNTREPFQISTHPMSSADIVGLICRENGPCPGVIDPLTLAKDRPRTHSSGGSSLRRHNKNNFVIKNFTVRGSMFDKNNWTETTPQD